MNLIPMKQQVGLIPETRFDFQVSPERLVLAQVFSRSLGVAQLPGVTRHKVRKRAYLGKSFGLVQQLQKRVQGAVQFVVTVRQAEPTARPVRKHPGKLTSHVTGSFPVANSGLDLPPDHEDLRVKAIQPGYSVRFHFGLDWVA